MGLIQSSQDAPSNMMTGIENVGPGWHPLIRKLESDLNQIKTPIDVLQVKEKFGGLRYYIGMEGGSTEDWQKVRDLIDRAEAKSFKVCEECGSTEKVSSKGRWIKTLCSKCREKREQP